MRINQNLLNATLTISFDAIRKYSILENNPTCAFAYNSLQFIKIHQILLDKSNHSIFEVESDLLP